MLKTVFLCALITFQQLVMCTETIDMHNLDYFEIEHASETPCAAYSPDGQMLAVVLSNNIVKLLDAKTNQPLLTLKDKPESKIHNIHFGQDSKALAYLSLFENFQGILTIWNLIDRKVMRRIEMPPFSDFAILPDGTIVHSHIIHFYPNICSNDGKIQAWTQDSNVKLMALLGTFKKVHTLKMNHSPRYTIFNPDGTRLAVVLDEMIQVFNTTDIKIKILDHEHELTKSSLQKSLNKLDELLCIENQLIKIESNPELAHLGALNHIQSAEKAVLVNNFILH